ncbi:SubName: Full=Uncharacterized protein {ECO:0000313/EMBL:CCA74199.1} [Serendipita indica DSM 11827]|uniref:Uncharacterized protein n=1 Tax=Serendipita indica (strain DSM 11827) TaxID=1109443 RepID=G4TSA5_SERID|nr:SubName: Full=Uncharacterized protein {ECO:0000313/EMBL:CCA74199.1} [Serendipita indica DSM 11827]CCA74199.1 hypothetical protein PIIN_08152 [Serendipita indica DSM 11827]
MASGASSEPITAQSSRTADNTSHDGSPGRTSASRERIASITTETRNLERSKDLSIKRPSALRSRRTPRGTVLRLREEDLVHRDDVLENMSDVGSLVKDNTQDLVSADVYPESEPSNEVPLLSLVVTKRKGKTKALMDDYDLVSKPGSRAIITLDDDDQEFLDEWAPDFYVEEEEHYIYPSYSDVVRNGIQEKQLHVMS